jgi:predicted nucleotidyltransferase
MKPEQLLSQLQAALGAGIRSVILYGSAAAGDHAPKRSDYNVLVVADRLGVKEMTALSKPSLAWQKAGNPPPLFFTLERLKKSADVFPIELMDIRDSRKILYGEDVIGEVEIHPENLRLVLEHELKSHLIRLRDAFIATGAKPKRVVELLVESLSTTLVLFRASLRLFDTAVPMRKIDALEQLASHIRFDHDIFEKVEAVKEGRTTEGDIDALALFERYLATIEVVVDAVDEHIHADVRS